MRMLFAIAAAVLLPGCSTMVHGTTQDIAVQTSPEVEATCEVKASEGAVYQVQTPGMVTVARSSSSLTVDCTKQGYEDAREFIASEFNGATFGNILAGGLIGVVADAASGANNSYPETVIIEMAALSSPENDGPADAVSETPMASRPDGTPTASDRAESASEGQQNLGDAQLAVADPGPYKSREEVSRYLTSNGSALKNRLSAYNQQHNLLESRPFFDGQAERNIRRIESYDVLSVSGKQADVEITYSVGHTKVETGTYVFTMEWVGRHLHFIKHRPAGTTVASAD